MRFEWDEAKNQTNRAKHGVTFEEAITVFDSDQAIDVFDPAHSETEDRFITIWPIPKGLVLVVWTERDEDVVRVISARWATKTEQRLYQRRMRDLR